jgi:uncharacterized membrane protein
VFAELTVRRYARIKFETTAFAEAFEPVICIMLPHIYHLLPFTQCTLQAGVGLFLFYICFCSQQ